MSRAHALASRDVPRSVPNGHPVRCMFSYDWHGSYENGPMVDDEPKGAEETAAPATAVLEDADGTEPQMATPDGWNLAASAGDSPSTVTPVFHDPQVTALRTHLHSLGVDVSEHLTTVIELPAFTSAKYKPQMGGSSYRRAAACR